MTAVAGAAVLLWIAFTALAEPELPEFRAMGNPVELSPEGDVQVASLDEFNGMLVGQLGRVVVVNVWASWCAPCRAEMPLLQNAATDFGDSITMLGVASNDVISDTEEFLADVGVSYPNIFDADGSIARALEVSAYPTTFVFDADGAIRARVDGGISEQRLAGLIEAALE